MPSEVNFQCPQGLIALTSPGNIRVETSQAILNAVRAADRAGMQLSVGHFGGALVDKARNDAARAMLNGPYGFVLYVDGDMTFGEDAFVRLAHTAYTTGSQYDAVGAYCVLRGGAMPTIDTGTGTWESHLPGSGLLEVIRTGGAFILVKRQVFEKVQWPWFSVRSPMRWLDALGEIDNLARVMNHGTNPFRALPGHPWEKMVTRASTDPQSKRPTADYEVGEDSNFCDLLKLNGLRVAVDTNLEISHIDVQYLNGASHRERLDSQRRETRQIYGVLQ